MDSRFEILPFNELSLLGLAVLLLPLLSFLILSFWPGKGNKGVWVATFILFIALVASIYLFISIWNTEIVHARWVWFELTTEIQITAGIWLNNLTVLLLVLVTLVSFLVHLFSIEYMKSDKGIVRYFSFLGLFTFSMLGIVVSDSLLLIFIFWELVGLSSYLLIGFWFHKDSASAASKKAFLVNRIGDLGFLAGLMLLWFNFNTLDLTILMELADLSNPVWIAISLCLFCGVVGKSAQFPLQVWLPDAMEGPTPVSALIHAATMVAAGVFLLARIHSFIPVDALHIIALVGALTAFMGGIAAIRQFDIKKILAYSTISQLGYMVLGVGAGAYEAAIFHLLTHAFFKACLFLSAGAIIHSLHHTSHTVGKNFDAQDIRLMGGLKKHMPFTYWVFLLSSLALMGVPMFSGFLSKDAILIASGEMMEGMWAVVPLLGFVTVLLTAFYVVRMLLIVFAGDNRLNIKLGTDQYTIEDTPSIMKLPLGILAIGSLFFVFSLNPLDGSHSWLMLGMGAAESHHGMLIPMMSLILVVAGGGYAFVKFKPNGSYVRTVYDQPNYTGFLEQLSFKNWFLNEIYGVAFVKQFLNLATILNVIETKIIDKAVDLVGMGGVIASKIIGWVDKNIVDGMVHLAATISSWIGWLSKGIQNGKVQIHIAWAGLGVLLILIWLIL